MSIVLLNENDIQNLENVIVREILITYSIGTNYRSIFLIYELHVVIEKWRLQSLGWRSTLTGVQNERVLKQLR